MWTKNFQLYKLDLEKAAKPEIKLPTSTGWQRESPCREGSGRLCSPWGHKESDMTEQLSVLQNLEDTTVQITKTVEHTTKLCRLQNCKILEETGIPDNLTFLLRNLYASQKPIFRTEHKAMDGFKIGRGVHQGCILLPCLFSFYAGYITWNTRLDKSQARIKIAGRNINNLS